MAEEQPTNPDKMLIKTREEHLARKKAGIAEAGSSDEAEDWKPYATRYLKSYLERHQRMHVDDLWSSGLEIPECTARVLGTVIRQACKAGWIEKIFIGDGDDYVARDSVTCRTSVKPVWKSNLYKGCSN